MPNPYYIKTTTPGEALSSVFQTGAQLTRLEQLKQEASLAEREFGAKYGTEVKDPKTGQTTRTPGLEQRKLGVDEAQLEVQRGQLEIEQAKNQEDIALNSSFGDRYPYVVNAMLKELGIDIKQFKKIAPKSSAFLQNLKDDPKVTNAEAHAKIKANLSFIKNEVSEGIANTDADPTFMPTQKTKLKEAGSALSSSPEDTIMGTFFPQVHGIIKGREALAAAEIGGKLGKPVSLAAGATLVDPTTGRTIATGADKKPTYKILGGNIYGIEDSKATLIKKGSIDERAVTNAMKDADWQFADEAEQAQLIEKHKRFITGTAKPSTKKLTPALARKFLKEAGGNKDQARQMARDQGYEF